MALGAVRTLKLLQQVKNVYECVAAHTDLPAEPLVRGQFLVVRQPAEFVDKLKALDQQFWADAEGLSARLQQFARDHGLSL
jgi:hypothetical protein